MGVTIEEKVFDDIPKSDIPNWLNDDFFINIIEMKLNLSAKEFEVKINSIKPAVGSGENYVSGIYRIRVEVKILQDEKIEIHSFILKNMLKAGDDMKQHGLFEKEINIYSDIIPALENEFKLIGENVQFGPRCYKATTKPADILVFDDLNACDYKVGNRREGLDIEHCRVFLSKLAKFHAASAHYMEKNGPYSDYYKSKIASLGNVDLFEVWLKPIFPKYYDAIRSNKKFEHLCVKLVS